MNEFAEVLLSVKKSSLRVRIMAKIRHWIWRWKVRNKPEVFNNSCRQINKVSKSIGGDLNEKSRI